MDVDQLENSIEDSATPRTNKKKVKGHPTTEETVEDLIAKLEQKGKKVVLKDENH